MTPSTAIARPRDAALDALRSYLVLSMIVYHGFFWQYAGGGNHRISFHITLGFILLAGGLFTGLNLQAWKSRPREIRRKIVGRAARLYLVYLSANLFILAIRPERLSSYRDHGWALTIKEFLLPQSSRTVSFEILAAISLTIFLIPLLYRLVHSRTRALVSFFLLLALACGNERFESVENFTIKLTCVGLAGGSAALFLSRFEWSRVESWLRSHRVVVWGLGLGTVTHFALFSSVLRHSPVTVLYHILGTMVILAFVYVAALQFRPERLRLGRIVLRGYGGHLLLAYLTQEAGLIISVKATSGQQYGFVATLGLAALLALATLLVCLAVDRLEQMSGVVRRVYRFALH